MKSRCIPDEPDERFRAAETSCLIERGRRGAAAEAGRGGSGARRRQVRRRRRRGASAEVGGRNLQQRKGMKMAGIAVV
ncbi:uncharacterized protein DS421_12g371240 [Arachis hypogaea]|nr:uncharacterized protein DS421_12g371240 [Arachis hypogaea]